MEIAEEAFKRIYWSDGDELASAIGRYLETCDAIEKFEWAGSYRRGRETIGDLDLLVVATDRDAAMNHFEAYPDRTKTIARGDTKISIRIGKAFQVDMRVVER